MILRGSWRQIVTITFPRTACARGHRYAFGPTLSLEGALKLPVMFLGVCCVIGALRYFRRKKEQNNRPKI